MEDSAACYSTDNIQNAGLLFLSQTFRHRCFIKINILARPLHCFIAVKYVEAPPPPPPQQLCY